MFSISHSTSACQKAQQEQSSVVGGEVSSPLPAFTPSYGLNTLAPPPASWSQIHASTRHLGGSSSGSSVGSICGKRSRSNSSSSSGYFSDSGSSAFSSNNQLVESPATSLSGQSAPESDEEPERSCPSPSAGKRKALRRAWRHDACTADAPAQSPAYTTAKKPAAAAVATTHDQLIGPASSVSSSASTSPNRDLEDVNGAVQAFGLASREHTPESVSSLSSATTPSKAAAVATPASGNSHGSPVSSKVNLVDHLVDAAVATIEAIWNSPTAYNDKDAADMPPCTASALPLPLFIRETLRRSRTSCSTLQAALLYCLRCAPAVRKQRIAYQSMTLSEKADTAAIVMSERAGLAHPLLCGRRIFLASVMVASKFLQDRNFSNKAWSRLTGLPLKQLGLVEREFLAAIGWDLNVKQDEWDRWVRKLTEAKFSKGTNVTPANSSAAASHASALPTDVVTPVAHRAVALIKASAEEQQDRSGSSTPTPATVVRPRANLARIHSDDGPFRAFDASLSASSSLSTPVVGGHAVASSTSREQASGKQSETTADRLAPPTALAQPYPMPRAFTRNSHSFSSGASRLAAMHTPQEIAVGAHYASRA